MILRSIEQWAWSHGINLHPTRRQVWRYFQIEGNSVNHSWGEWSRCLLDLSEWGLFMQGELKSKSISTIFHFSDKFRGDILINMGGIRQNSWQPISEMRWFILLVRIFHKYTTVWEIWSSIWRWISQNSCYGHFPKVDQLMEQPQEL